MPIKNLPIVVALTFLGLISRNCAVGQDSQANSHITPSKVADFEPQKQSNLHGFINRFDVDSNPGKTEQGSGPIKTSPVSDGDHTLRLELSPFVAPGAFGHWMNSAHPGFAHSHEKRDPSSLVLMMGNHENIKPQEHLFGIRCSNIAMSGLDATISGGNCKVLTNVLINDCGCACRSTLGGKEEVERRAQHIRNFVSNGGYLLLTGGDLGSVEQLFPGVVDIINSPYNGGSGSEYLYDATLVKPDPVIGNRVVTNGLWLLDYNPSIKILRPDLVRVICRSKKLANERPDGEGVLAALFSYGRGYVMCIAGSLRNNPGIVFTKFSKTTLFSNQLPDAAPKIHIAMRQALAGNFIEAGLTRTRIPMN